MRLVRSFVAVTVFGMLGAMSFSACTDDENPTAKSDGGTTTGRQDSSTGSDTGGGGGGDTGTGGDTNNPQAISCTNYCTILGANCTGANLQYPNVQACTRY